LDDERDSVMAVGGGESVVGRACLAWGCGRKRGLRSCPAKKLGQAAADLQYWKPLR